ncbi:peptidase inhibitor family I36 protein [Micromonospora sp. RTGN7]|uniref:peptidase inhibitor family I36 protein n=1 Tax=Micromonospora sp. RTGN7 TaxID=3016526 RepID=UPI0029FF44AD|nr:peptidase inhibitor family I36 protein [Micromonospora sp. RTGN7]
MTLGLTGALTAATLVGTASVATAHACPSGATCSYPTTNWGGAPGPVYGDNSDLTGYYKWTHSESIYNNGASCNVTIYSGIGRGGTAYPLNRGTGWKTISGSKIWHHAYSNKWFC